LITPQSYKWFFEPTTAVEGHMHAIRRTIVEAQTKFQHMEIMETPAYGKVLVLDGRIQSSQAEDFIYHEALVHPGMLASERAPESGLVIGGGEGATLREILRYPTVKRAVMVDIDGEVVDLCKRHLPEMHQGAFDDPRSEVRNEDARGYLEKTAERFDFITVDLVEPLEEGPACLLFTKEFYTLVRDRLTPGGAMTLQAGMTKFGELDFFTSIHRTLREVFPVVAAYQTFISCFGTPWGFITATKKVDPRRQDIAAVDRLIADRIRGSKGATPPSNSPGGSLGYWDGQTHQHAFHLPKHIRAAIDAQTRVVTDAHPLIVT
jgi:spermidine synthase